MRRLHIRNEEAPGGEELVFLREGEEPEQIIGIIRDRLGRELADWVEHHVSNQEEYDRDIARLEEELERVGTANQAAIEKEMALVAEIVRLNELLYGPDDDLEDLGEGYDDDYDEYSPDGGADQ